MVAVEIAAATLLALACGSRTGLLAPERGDDASLPDARPDAREAGPDVIDAAEEDALPPIDATKQDVVVPNDCPDASLTLVYLITSQNQLYSFYPPTHAFKKIGNIACPTAGSATPYSMAVDRLGVAYSVFTDGRLFQLSTATASCQTTTYAPGQLGFQTFGMGFEGDQNGEQLFVAEANFNGLSKGLGIIDTQSFTLGFVGNFSPPLPRCELTGTGDARLFAFCLDQGGSGSVLSQIDPATANVIGANKLAVGAVNDAFAFAFWGGDFWIFTSPGGASTVTQYDPLTQKETAVATLGSTIVGAGVSTCAPQ